MFEPLCSSNVESQWSHAIASEWCVSDASRPAESHSNFKVRHSLAVLIKFSCKFIEICTYYVGCQHFRVEFVTAGRCKMHQKSSTQCQCSSQRLRVCSVSARSSCAARGTGSSRSIEVYVVIVDCSIIVLVLTNGKDFKLRLQFGCSSTRSESAARP